MATFGYQASHEQFPPSILLQLAKKAEAAGFKELASSDHLMPWSGTQGHSGFAWSWMAAALATTNLPCGVVTAPIDRYHPVIIAQACATLAEMFPDRFWVTMGSGEFLNEHITGHSWPTKPERNERLLEAVQMIRRLWKGERFTHKGKYFTAEEVQVYSLPQKPLPIFAAAITEETAHWAGSWADGMYTISQPEEQLKKVIRAFKEGGGEGKPIHLKVQVSVAPTSEEALQLAFEQWKTNIAASSINADLRLPEDFEKVAQYVKKEDLPPFVRMSQDPTDHINWLKKDVELGFEKIVLHNVGINQEYFIEWYGKNVLPEFKSS